MINQSESSSPRNAVDYYPLPSGKADVFMRKNEIVMQGDEGVSVYTADEVSYQVDLSITKEFIEANFDLMWNKVINGDLEPKLDDIIAGLKKRQEETENSLLFLLDVTLGGM